jgi:hypothetical protein
MISLSFLAPSRALLGAMAACRVREAVRKSQCCLRAFCISECRYQSHVLESDALAGAQALAGFLDAPQKSGIVLETPELRLH